MPYIITTYDKPATAPGWTAAQRAVATFQEAYDHIVAAVAGTSRRASVLDDARWTYADKLPTDGGTVGPLPDGTCIEVKPITYAALCERVGHSPRQAIINAFNGC